MGLLGQIVFILSDSNQFDDCVFIHPLKYSEVLGCGGGARLTCWLGNRFGLNQVPSQLEHHSRASGLSAEGHVLLTDPCRNQIHK